MNGFPTIWKEVLHIDLKGSCARGKNIKYAKNITKVIFISTLKQNSDAKS